MSADGSVITGEINFPLRDYQRKAIKFITGTLETKNAALLEAPTGSGKTLIALISAISYARIHKAKILYLTRTNTQQENVFRDLKKLSGVLRIKAAPIQGRQNMCLLYREISGEKDFSPESLSKFCTHRKLLVKEGRTEACRFYNERMRSTETQSRILGEYLSAEEIVNFGIAKEICPYEAIKASLKNAELVVAPYAFFLNYGIAERFLSQWGIDRSQLLLVMDEAHNLPDLARNVASFSITEKSVDMAESELKRFGDPELDRGIRGSDLTEYVRDSLLVMGRDYLRDQDEARISSTEFMENLMLASRLSSNDIHNMISRLDIIGENIASSMERDGKIPRSSVQALTTRLLAMEELDEDTFINVISRDRGTSLSIMCLDPAAVLKPLRESKSIHISGTLRPTDAYKRITGFDDAGEMVISDVFPPENHLLLYSNDFSTRFETFDEAEAERMRGMIEKIILQVNRKCIIFFPSHSVMEKVTSSGFAFPYLMESKEMKQEEISELIADFRKGPEPLMAVSGGRISEGLDFPGNQLEMVIVAGIPFPKPDVKQRALNQLYDRLYGRGWEMAVTFPAAVRTRQEIGRLIRSEKDQGVSIVLDSRITGFRRYFPGMRSSDDPVAEAQEFFESRGLKNAWDSGIY